MVSLYFFVNIIGYKGNSKQRFIFITNIDREAFDKKIVRRNGNLAGGTYEQSSFYEMLSVT